MNTAVAWRGGHVSDPGRARGINEDRILAEEARGIFVVVDGLGGHAAGEMAAETACRVISENVGSLDGKSDDNIRRAITEANNQIYELSQTNENWRGMACVLTLAIVQEDQVAIGHVGDTRLYLVWNGNLRKITPDHSPVGELEDAGELTEEQAMRHPRRNEVFRDVGSRLRSPDDPGFIDVRRVPLRSDAALLLCSDGLSDVLTSSQMLAIVERYDGDPTATAGELVAAANDAGGKDNISVVFVAGPEFLGLQSNTLTEVRSRHTITRPTAAGQSWRRIVAATLWLLTGIVLGVIAWVAAERMIPGRAPVQKTNTIHIPVRVRVNAGSPLSLSRALASAGPGDTLEVAAGEYLGPIELKSDVNVIATGPREVIIKNGAASSSDVDIAVVARGVTSARVEGLRIVGDAAHTLRTGVLLSNSSIELADSEISGAANAGVQIDGTSHATLLGNFIHDNAGPGAIIQDQSAPRLAGNNISENGKLTNPFQPGVVIVAPAQPVLQNNTIVQNGLATIVGLTDEQITAVRNWNTLDDGKTRPRQYRARAAVSGMR